MMKAFVNKTLNRACLYLILCLTLFACSETEQNKLDNIESTEKQHSLTLIVHPYDNPSRLVARFSPLTHYLGKQLNQPVELVIARSYVDQIQRITSGQADLAYMGPTPFLRAQDHYLHQADSKLIPLAAEVQQGAASYRSVIVVREDSTIMNLVGLKNRTFAFGAPHSFSSHYVPRVMIGNSGIAFNDLRDYAFLGRHERVALAVLHGDFDAGGINEAVATQYREREPGLRIIATSPPLPPHLIVARPDLPDHYIDVLRRALIHPPAGSTDFIDAMQALGDSILFMDPEMSRFERARRVIEAVESNPAELAQW